MSLSARSRAVVTVPPSGTMGIATRPNRLARPVRSPSVQAPVQVEQALIRVGTCPTLSRRHRLQRRSSMPAVFSRSERVRRNVVRRAQLTTFLRVFKLFRIRAAACGHRPTLGRRVLWQSGFLARPPFPPATSREARAGLKSPPSQVVPASSDFFSHQASVFSDLIPTRPLYEAQLRGSGRPPQGPNRRRANVSWVLDTAGTLADIHGDENDARMIARPI